MNQIELKERTTKFAIRVMKLVRAFPKSEESRIIARQILRSATSVAANYRAVCRSRSRKDFIAKMAIVLEESDETQFWLELLVASEIMKPELLENLMKEANELTSIFSASLRTAKKS